MKRTRVMIDAFWFIEGPPSGRHVGRSIVREWLTRYPEDISTLLVRRHHRDSVERQLDEWGIPASQYNLALTAVRPHGLAVLLAAAHLHDIFLTQNFAPLRRSTTQLTFVHDAIFADHPEWFSFSEKLYLRLAAASARRSTYVLTSSKSEALRIRRTTSRRNQGRVRAVGLAIPVDFHHAEPTAPCNFEHDIAFLLAVGRLNVRKNVNALIRALHGRGILSRDLKLVVVGQKDGTQETRTVDGTDHVLFLGGVTDSELKWLYSHCRAFVFPSLDEGFGLPILEARSCNAPMAVSNIPAFREIAAEDAMFEPTCDSSIADTVARIVSEPPRNSAPGMERTWSHVVDEIRQIGLGETHDGQ